MNIYIIIGMFIFILLIGIFLILKFTKKRGLSSEQAMYFSKIMKRISTGLNSKEKITDYDKLYHKILHALGYEGSFGEILKSEATEISNINKIWELHKLRNKLVHEFDLLEETVLKRKASEYEKEIRSLLKRVS